MVLTYDELNELNGSGVNGALTGDILGDASGMCAHTAKTYIIVESNRL